jgi:ABC-type glycerol-3-phosphate transport system substrate-binding protein
MIDNGDSKDQQKKDKAAWEYMRWYTGSEFQADYSNEIVSILGIAARPATANQLALEDLPWTAEEKNNILEQFRSLKAVPNHPGAYYLARYVNFAFLAAYNEGEDASDALLSYVSTINSELTRRRKEFGMLTYDDYMKLNPNGELTSPTVGE